MNELNRFVNETLEKLEVEIGDYSEKVSKLRKEIDDVKLQNNILRKENEKKSKENDELKLENKQLKDKLKQLEEERLQEETSRKNEELQKNLDTILDELKRKGLLTVLTRESQINNNESLIKLIITQKEKTDTELEDLKKELQLTKKELRRQKDQNLSKLTKKEFKFDINDIPGYSTSIKTELEFKNNKSTGFL